MGGTKTPYSVARDRFESYCYLDAPDLPGERMSNLQTLLARWEIRNFGAQPGRTNAAGVSEEVGELAEAVLALAAAAGKIKAEQGIRVTDDEQLRALVADAVADIQVFSINLCTKMRVDYGTLLFQTAEKVMQRDWKARPLDAHKDDAPKPAAFKVGDRVMMVGLGQAGTVIKIVGDSDPAYFIKPDCNDGTRVGLAADLAPLSVEK
jgi:NTP pyrophosphatase (non-canonical NTP hydrolase)